MGMSVSLIPTIVSSFVKKDFKDVNSKMNKAYQIILVISIPCAIGLAILAKPVWTIFYGTSTYGPQVLSMMVISAIFANLYSITFNAMQSMNKFKIVYLSVFAGFGANAMLDIPLIILLDKLGLPAFFGAPLATIIGYNISMQIAKRNLRKNHRMSFASTYKMAAKLMVPTILMVLALVAINRFVPFDIATNFGCIIMIVVNAIIGGIIYLGVSYKMGLFDEIFGREYMKKIIKKLTFGKVSLK